MTNSSSNFQNITAVLITYRKSFQKSKPKEIVYRNYKIFDMNTFKNILSLKLQSINIFKNILRLKTSVY